MRNKIIGVAIDKYDDQSIAELANCQSGLNQLIEVFTARYEIDEVQLFLEKEQTKRSFLYKNLYLEIINSCDDENLILIFFGHGEYNELIGNSYWMTSDSVYLDQSTWLSVIEILSFLKNSKLKHFCLISDCCYSGAIFEQLNRGGGLSTIENKRSRFALTSGGIEKVKDGEKGDTSPFNKVLCQKLNDNQLPELPFNTLALEVVRDFPENSKQTPKYGSLKGIGDEEGCFILRLIDQKSREIKIREIHLQLNIDNKVNIDFDCVVPMFESNSIFDVNIINVSIQHLAYDLINSLRILFSNENESEFSKKDNVDYHIFGRVGLVSEKYLSITVSTDFYLGGAYPANEIFFINYKLNPEVRIRLRDILKVNDEDKFFAELVEKYSDCEEQREVLTGYVDRFRIDDIIFGLTENSLEFYLLNYIPKVVQCYAFLSIPYKDYNIDVGEIYKVTGG